MRTGIFEKGMPMQPWYEKAVDIFIHIAKAEEPAINKYTRKGLWSEVSRFCDWYSPYVNNHATNTADRRAFHDMWQPLFDRILDVPKTTVLWDYHADNLMIVDEDLGEDIYNLGVIYFQDARVGPISYDMSMLLQDARYVLPKDMEKELIKRFIDALEGMVTMEKFMRGYRIINLQRTLKIIAD